MLVCHKWYVIGLQAASLWTDIDFARQGSSAPVLLTRSLGAPIRLYGSLDAWTDNILSTAIADNGPRVCELDLWVGSNLSGFTNVNALTVVAHPDVPARFPALEAMLLESFLFVPAHALPQLTHLHLAWLDEIDPSRILDLMRNTPALQVLKMIQSSEYTGPQDPAAPGRASVFLPHRLHSVHLGSLTSTIVHDLMTHIEAPSLAAVSLSSIWAKSGALVSTPLIPDSLSTRTITRLAFDLSGYFNCFRTAFHGPDLSLSLDINFPGILPLSRVDELHFRAQMWPGAGTDLLLHLAAHTPAVSTLVVKHGQDTRECDTGGLMGLAWAVSALLSGNGPVLFPRLAHLELVVGDIPQGFCDVLARGLAQRALDPGRRLKKLRIRLDYALRSRLATRWMFQEEPDDDSGTSIYEHVDSVKIDKKNLSIGHTGDEDDGELSNTVEWGEWRDILQPAQHDYW